MYIYIYIIHIHNSHSPSKICLIPGTTNKTWCNQCSAECTEGSKIFLPMFKHNSVYAFLRSTNLWRVNRWWVLVIELKIRRQRDSHAMVCSAHIKLTLGFIYSTILGSYFLRHCWSVWLRKWRVLITWKVEFIVESKVLRIINLLP